MPPYTSKRGRARPPTSQGLDSSFFILAAYSPRGIGKEFNTGPTTRQGGVLPGSIGLQRAAAPPLLSPGTREQCKDRSRQGKRAQKSRRLNDVRVNVVVSESAHVAKQYSTYSKLSLGPSSISAPQPRPEVHRPGVRARLEPHTRLWSGRHRPNRRRKQGSSAAHTPAPDSAGHPRLA